jgi:hypothetical protein
VIVVLVASHNSPTDRSDQRSKGNASITATATDDSRPDDGAFTHCHNSRSSTGDAISSRESWNDGSACSGSAGLA